MLWPASTFGATSDPLKNKTSAKPRLSYECDTDPDHVFLLLVVVVVVTWHDRNGHQAGIDTTWSSLMIA